MRLLLTLCLGLCIIAIQVVLGVKAFFPDAYADKTDVVDALMEQKKSILDQIPPAELAWVTEHPVIVVGVDPNFYPLETFDERGRYTGLGGDYLRLLSKLTGLGFRAVRRLTDWASEGRPPETHRRLHGRAAGRWDAASITCSPRHINVPGIITRCRGGAALDRSTCEGISGAKGSVDRNCSGARYEEFITES